MEIKLLDGCRHPQEIGVLFTEYTEMLIAGDETFREYLAIQHYDAELADLRQKYGPPTGRLYLLTADGAVAGCIGMKKLDDDRCEMKRLYIRPQYRGQGLARRLVTQIITDAQKAGYTCMMLDTLPFLQEAIALYRAYGFCEVGCYNDSPMESSLYMQLEL